MNTSLFLYLLWFSFYGQFEFWDEFIKFKLDISTSLGPSQNPFGGFMIVDNGRIVFRKEFLLLSGLIWDALICWAFWQVGKINARKKSLI